MKIAHKIIRLITNNNKINAVHSLQIFQLIRFFSLILISIVFAKSKLNLSQIGSYEKFIFISSVLSFFWVSGGIQAFLILYQNNKSFKKEEGKTAEIFNFFIFLMAASLIMISIFQVFQNTIAPDFQKFGFSRQMLIYLIVFPASQIIEYIYLLKKEKWKLIRYGLTTFLLQILAVTMPILLGFNIEYSIWGLIGVVFLRFAWLMRLMVIFSQFKFSFTFQKELLILAAPLILTCFFAGSSQYLSNYFVSSNFDISSFAIFMYGAKELPITAMLSTALGMAMVPKLSQSHKFLEDVHILKNKTKELMHIIFPLTIILILISKPLFLLIFNPKFTESASIFNIYLLITISRVLLPNTLLMAKKNTNILLLASLLELVVIIGLSAILMRIWGIKGIAISVSISYFIEKVILSWFCYKKLGIVPSKFIDFHIWLIYTIVTVFTYLAVEFFF